MVMSCGGEEGFGSLPERGGGCAVFVAEHFAVLEAVVAVDRSVHQRVADLGAMPTASLVCPSVHSPAAAFGDPPEFLDVDVHELAGASECGASRRVVTARASPHGEPCPV